MSEARWHDAFVEECGYPAVKFGAFVKTLDEIVRGMELPAAQPLNILDTGYGWGLSAVYWLRQFRNAHIITIDPYWPGTYSDAKDIMQFQPLVDLERWRFIQGTAEDVERLLDPGGGVGLPYYTVFDIVFLDADHGYPSTLQQLQALWPYVASGGVLFGHDYCSTPGVHRAVDEFAMAIGQTPTTDRGYDDNGWYSFRKEA